MPDGRTRIVLSRGNLYHACGVGVMRKAMHKWASFNGQAKIDQNDQRGGPDLDPWDEIEAACAEYAVALLTNRFWSGDFRNRAKTVDIPPDIEVRWTKHANGHLLLYDRDEPEHRFVLVTGNMPEYFVHGWLRAKDGMKAEYYGLIRPDRPPCFKVPQDALQSIADLICC